MERHQALPRPARIAIAALLAIHGLIHLVGVVVPWGIATVDGFAYRTSVLGGAFDLGDTGVRILGLAWLAVCIGFVVAAAGVLLAKPWWLPLASGLAIASILLCIAGIPDAVTGIPVDAAIIAICGFVALRRPDTAPART